MSNCINCGDDLSGEQFPSEAERDCAALQIGRRWLENSSLELWFPITAEQIAQLTKERDDLQIKFDERGVALDFSELACERIAKERDQLSAKCAEMRDAVKANDEHHQLVDDRGDYLGSKLYCINDHALSDQCGVGWLSPKQQDEEIGRWQQAIYDLLCQFCTINIDGAGSDSGDPLDFTLAEIGQALAHLQNKVDERLSPAQKKVLVEALERMAGYAATVRLDRRKVVDGEIMCLQMEDWCNGLLERVEKAKQALEDCK